jgi:hypothetical protein
MRLRRVLLNLMSNADEFTEKGTLTITARQKHRRRAQDRCPIRGRPLYYGCGDVEISLEDGAIPGCSGPNSVPSCIGKREGKARNRAGAGFLWLLAGSTFR